MILMEICVDERAVAKVAEPLPIRIRCVYFSATVGTPSPLPSSKSSTSGMDELVHATTPIKLRLDTASGRWWSVGRVGRRVEVPHTGDVFIEDMALIPLKAGLTMLPRLTAHVVSRHADSNNNFICVQLHSSRQILVHPCSFTSAHLIPLTSKAAIILPPINVTTQPKVAMQALSVVSSPAMGTFLLNPLSTLRDTMSRAVRKTRAITNRSSNAVSEKA